MLDGLIWAPNKQHSSEDGQWAKMQPVSKEKYWMIFRKPVELSLKNTLKTAMKTFEEYYIE